MLTTVEGLLDSSPQRWGVNVFEQVEARKDVVIFPQGLAGIIAAGVGTQLADDNGLGGGFQSQGDNDALNIVPLPDDQLFIELANGLE